MLRPRQRTVMSPGRRPRPCRASHGVSMVMMTTPTARTSSHFSIAASGSRVATALDRDTYLAHVADVSQLGDGKLHPRRAEVVHDDVAAVLGQRLEQLEAPVRELALDALDHLAVVDRVVDVVGASHL